MHKNETNGHPSENIPNGPLQILKAFVFPIIYNMHGYEKVDVLPFLIYKLQKGLKMSLNLTAIAEPLCPMHRLQGV